MPNISKCKDIGEAIEKGIIPENATVHICVSNCNQENKFYVSIFSGSPKDLPSTLKKIPCKYIMWNVKYSDKVDIDLSILFLYVNDIPESWLSAIGERYRSITEEDLKFSYMREIIKYVVGERNYFDIFGASSLDLYPSLELRFYITNMWDAWD